VRRNTMLMIAAIAAIMIVPATGFAKTNDAKQDRALVKPVVNKLNTVAKGLATLNRLAATKVALAATNSAVSILKTGLATAQGDITTLQTDDAAAKTSITSINGQLAAGAAALTSINSALTNSTTGLVGLNAARPQFGAFGPTGTFINGTGAVSGASGPKSNAVGTHAIPGLYVIDFGNDVSSRFLVANPFPGSGVGTAQAVDCASPGAASTCGGAEGVASDNSANHVLVAFGAGGTNPGAGFEIAAISG
jgi:hypothetical protein